MPRTRRLVASLRGRRAPATHLAPELPSVPALESACFAPHSALYLQPTGNVSACCATSLSLGKVTGPNRQTLRQIWDGAVLASQRAAVEGGDFSMGCDECEFVAIGGGRRASLAYHFDRFAPGAPHSYPKMLDLALSNRCNLQCVMCHGALSSTIRAKREGLPPLPAAYDDQFFDELDEFLPHLERLQFKGGEPFLAKENRRIWDRLLELGLHPEIKVTTNGTILNENIERYVRDLNMEPILSVDGIDADVLESIRVGVNAPVFWHHVDRYQAITQETGKSLTLSYCLMANNWRELLPFLRETDRRHLNPNVVVVNSPMKFSLLDLPHHDLTDIHRQLTSQRPTFHDEHANRIWLEVMDQITHKIETPVDLQSLTNTSTAAEALVERVSRDDAEPVRIMISRDMITEVSAPAWASWLPVADLIGTSSNDVLPTLERLLSATSDLTDITATDPAVHEWAIELRSASELRRLHVYRHVIEWPHGAMILLTPMPVPGH